MQTRTLEQLSAMTLSDHLKAERERQEQRADERLNNLFDFFTTESQSTRKEVSTYVNRQ